MCGMNQTNPYEWFYYRNYSVLGWVHYCKPVIQTCYYRKCITDQLHLRIQQRHCMRLTRVFPFGPPFPLRSTNMVSILFPSQATSLFLWPSYYIENGENRTLNLQKCSYANSMFYKCACIFKLPLRLAWPGPAAALTSWPSAADPQSLGTAFSGQMSELQDSWDTP